MRIALVTREFPPDTAWGGIGSFYAHFARSLAELGHDVEVFCQSISNDRSEIYEGALVHHVLVRPHGASLGVAHPTAGLSDLGEFAHALAHTMLEAVRDRHALKPFDLIESHEHLGINALIAAMRLPHAKIVTRYQSAYHSLVSRDLVDWPPSRIIRELERQSIHLADFRITTSQFIEDIARQDFDAPAADAEIFNLVAESPDANAPVARENVVAFVGRMVLGHKRPDLLARAFASLAPEFPDWRCEFAGPDMSHHNGPSVWALCQDLIPTELLPRVLYHGTLAPPVVRHLYRRAKLLVAPSSFESFGMVALEAMREGCVPIVSNRTALADVVDDPDLTFENGDVGALRAVLARLMSNPERVNEKAARCRQRAFGLTDQLIEKNLKTFSRFLQIPYEPPTARAPSTVRGMATASHEPVTNVDLPLVSIVVPSYNQGPFIEETLRSILDQDYPNKEVIVMDGGSTDNTMEVLSGFPQVRWTSEKDKGQTHAINKGMLAARGDIVAYLNSDDVYRPGAIRAIVEVFRKEPATQIVVGNCDYIDGHSNLIGHMKGRCDSITDIVRYWGWERWFCVPQQATFWRRSLMSEVGLFNTDLNMVMDFEYWLRVLQHTNFRVVDRTLAAFRLTQGTKTVSRTHEMYKEEYETFKRFRSVLAPWPRFKASLAARMHYGRKQIMMAQHHLLAARARRLSGRLLGEALRAWPPYVFRPEVFLCLTHLALSFVAPMPELERAHRFWLKLTPAWR